MEDDVSICKPTKRPLYNWEVKEAQTVFGDQIDYQKIRIHECSKLPSRLQRIGTFFNKNIDNQSPPAVCIGNNIFFPIALPKFPPSSDQDNLHKMSWMIHELTHVWQFQHIGWKYLYKAMLLQVHLGSKAYQFGGEAGLMKMTAEKKHISDFNLEQQGDIARSYYERKTQGKNIQAWEAFIDEIKHSRTT